MDHDTGSSNGLNSYPRASGSVMKLRLQDKEASLNLEPLLSFAVLNLSVLRTHTAVTSIGESLQIVRSLSSQSWALGLWNNCTLEGILRDVFLFQCSEFVRVIFNCVPFVSKLDWHQTWNIAWSCKLKYKILLSFPSCFITIASRVSLLSYHGKGHSRISSAGDLLQSLTPVYMLKTFTDSEP